jgi:hypothetical protein
MRDNASSAAVAPVERLAGLLDPGAAIGKIDVQNSITKGVVFHAG